MLAAGFAPGGMPAQGARRATDAGIPPGANPGGTGQMINDTSRQRAQRVSSKNLDFQFINEMVRGLACSPFEARAILEKVHEVFTPLFESTRTPLPGQVQLCVVDASAPPGIRLKEASQRLVTVTLYAPEDNSTAGIRRSYRRSSAYSGPC